jgi:hypothetical protein
MRSAGQRSRWKCLARENVVSGPQRAHADYNLLNLRSLGRASIRRETGTATCLSAHQEPTLACVDCQKLPSRPRKGPIRAGPRHMALASVCVTPSRQIRASH